MPQQELTHFVTTIANCIAKREGADGLRLPALVRELLDIRAGYSHYPPPATPQESLWPPQGRAS